MCDPVIIGFGLSAASQVAGFAAKQSETDEYNAASARNRQSAVLAATRGYQDEGSQLIYDEHKNQTEAYDAIMKARQVKGSVQASAGSAGFDASSLTVGDLVSESSRAEARDADNFSVKRDDLIQSYGSKVDSLKAQAEGRINSMPGKSGPSPLALGLGIANSALGSVESSHQGKTWLGIQ